jgi:hypothetical protein
MLSLPCKEGWEKVFLLEKQSLLIVFSTMLRTFVECKCKKAYL